MFLLATNCSTLTDTVAVFILKQPRRKMDAVVMGNVFKRSNYWQDIVKPLREWMKTLIFGLRVIKE